MAGREKSVDILDRLFWTVQPPPGLVKGQYYREEMRFAANFPQDLGHLGILEVITEDKKLRLVQFNEQCSPSYYIPRFQNHDKRYSDYGFFQASKERTAVSGVVLVNGITDLEQQMQEENRLTGSFDLLAGASNSLKRAMLPLAQKIAERIDQPSGQYYYGFAMSLEQGVSGRLQVVIEGERIVRFFYDEIFADRPEEIADPELKPYYRQSKYHCPDYISTSGAGFNVLSDLLRDAVLEQQTLLHLQGLPFDSEEYRAPDWDRYMKLAEVVDAEIKKDLKTSAAGH